MKPFVPPTKRLRLNEMKGEFLTRTGKRITNDDIAAVAFKRSRLKHTRRINLLSQWNNGNVLSQVTPEALAGMAEALGCKVKDLTGE